MITINKSATADTRTCDFKDISKETLLQSTNSHIEDVRKGINFAIEKLQQIANDHDWSKLAYQDMFYKDFQSGFKTTDWFLLHCEKERHHLKDSKYIQGDVNLFDVLEMIIDGVMAGLARVGKYKKEEIPNLKDLLVKAYDNTIDLFLENVEVKE